MQLPWKCVREVAGCFLQIHKKVEEREICHQNSNHSVQKFEEQKTHKKQSKMTHKTSYWELELHSELKRVASKHYSPIHNSHGNSWNFRTDSPVKQPFRSVDWQKNKKNTKMAFMNYSSAIADTKRMAIQFSPFQTKDHLHQVSATVIPSCLREQRPFLSTVYIL